MLKIYDGCLTSVDNNFANVIPILDSCQKLYILSLIKIAETELNIAVLNHITLDLLIFSFIWLDDIQEGSNEKSWEKCVRHQDQRFRWCHPQTQCNIMNLLNSITKGIALA